MARSVSYRVPGSTSNLGPGFDALGLALSIYNTTETSPADNQPDDPFLQCAAAAFFEAASLPASGFSCRISGEVPRSRGLGSSVTVRLGLLAGLNDLHGSPLSIDELFRLCSRLEGHPDNAAASCFGGFTICLPGGRLLRFPVASRLRFLLVVPAVECSTEEARRAVPTQFSREDAVFNLSHAAALAACLANGDYEQLTGLFADRIHQPARSRFHPHLEPLLAAAQSAGALGGWLSGSGSAVAIATLDAPAPLLAALRQIPGAEQIFELTADNHGLQKIDPSS